MLIRPAIGDTDPIRYRRHTPDGQFSGNIIDEAMRDSVRPGRRRADKGPVGLISTMTPTDAIHAIATGITGTAAIAADQVRHRAAHEG